MPKSLPDIIYDTSNKKNPIVDARNAFYLIPYYKDEEYFNSGDSYVRFVNGCKSLVRSDIRYKKYINHLKTDLKLDRCQVFKNITDDDAPIEMHHGPIFTLFDYCSIMTEYFLIKKWKISTPLIADAVLTEHEQGRIQTVMLSETMHEEVENGEIFINQKQAYGNLKEFIKKYACAFSEDYIYKVNQYIERSLLKDSDDFGILQLNPELYIKKNL